MFLIHRMQLQHSSQTVHAADPAVFGGQLPDSGKQLVIDGGNGYDWAYGCPGYGLPDKRGLAHVAGRKPFRKSGVFFLGHACFDYPAAVGRANRNDFYQTILSEISAFGGE